MASVKGFILNDGANEAASKGIDLSDERILPSQNGVDDHDRIVRDLNRLISGNDVDVSLSAGYPAVDVNRSRFLFAMVPELGECGESRRQSY